MKVLKSLIVVSLGIILFTVATQAQQLTWRNFYDASKPNIWGIDESDGAKIIRISPVSNYVYASGEKPLLLPAIPSGYGYRDEMAVICYDNVSGSTVASITINHNDLDETNEHGDVVNDMIVASDGSVYITGKYYTNDLQGNDMIVIKFNAILQEEWRHIFKGVVGSDDYGQSIAEDNNGNIIVIGKISDRGMGTGADFLIAKFNPNSSIPIWTKFRNSGTSSNDTPTDLIIDNVGNIYFCGYSTFSNSGKQLITVKYNSNGIVQWLRKYGVNYGSTSQFNNANSIVVDNSSGNVFVIGNVYNSLGNSDIVTLCYDSVGVRQWVQKINNSGNSNDIGIKVIIGPSSNIYVGGYVDRDAGAGFNGTLIYRVYDNAGNPLNTVRFYKNNNSCKFADMAISPNGEVYITGNYYDTQLQGKVMLTVKFDPFGTKVWNTIDEPSGGCNQSYLGFKIVINPINADVIVGGKYYFDCPGVNEEKWCIWKYNENLRFSNSGSLNNNQSIQLLAYPIPTNDILNISLSLTPTENLNLDIYNVYGQLIKSVKIKDKITSIDISELEVGNYLIQGSINGVNISQKFIKN